MECFMLSGKEILDTPLSHAAHNGHKRVARILPGREEAAQRNRTMAAEHRSHMSVGKVIRWWQKYYRSRWRSILERGIITTKHRPCVSSFEGDSTVTSSLSGNTQHHTKPSRHYRVETTTIAFLSEYLFHGKCLWTPPSAGEGNLMRWEYTYMLTPPSEIVEPNFLKLSVLRWLLTR